MATHLLAIDQGTTGTTALVITLDGQDARGAPPSSSRSTFPKPGWVEHDAERDLEERGETRRRARSRAASVAGERIAAIGITNQRETTLVWDREDRRADPPRDRVAVPPHRGRLRRAQGEGHEPTRPRRRPGSCSTPYFSGTKIAWILDHVDGARARAEHGELAFGTIDTFLVHRLTGGDGARDRRDERVAHAAHEPRARSRGTTSCSSSSACRARVLPKIVGERRRSSRRTKGVGVPARRHPDRGHRGRSAGRALRAGVLRGGRREVHVRHRRVRAR